jgi:hypothetical protein
VQIYDAVHGCATVESIPEMREVHQFMMGCNHIEILAITDNLNTPKPSGWVGLVYLCRILPAPKGGEDDGPSYMSVSELRQVSLSSEEFAKRVSGHICELKVTFGPTWAARQHHRVSAELRRARHLMRIIDATGPSINEPNDGVSESEGSEHDVIAVLRQQVAERDERIADLIRENAQLENGLGVDSGSTVGVKIH